MARHYSLGIGTVLAFAAILVIVAVRIYVVVRKSRKHRRWLRGLFRVEVPGFAATVIALLLAAEPSLATGNYQALFVVASIACFIWFAYVYFRNIYKEAAAASLRYAREALLLSNKLYNLIRDVKYLQIVRTHDTPPPDIERQIEQERWKAEDAYARYFRHDVRHFFQDLKRDDIWEDKEAADLADNMGYGIVEVEEIEQMASMLSCISSDIARYG